MARMTTPTKGRPAAAGGERPGGRANRPGESPATHPGLAILAGAIAVSAYGGALGLIAGFLPLGAVVTSRLPFASPVLGGIALLVVVAIPATAVAGLAARGDRRAADMAVAAGVLLAGWIVVELAFIRELSFFHPLFLVAGGLLIWLGVRARPRRNPESASGAG